tara:strand:- start:798406 stop:798945 length:540 start_codon:yes stop_codon:yes gene_type:complete
MMIAEFDNYYIAAIQQKDAWSLCDFMISNEDRLQRYLPKTLAQNLTPELSKIFVEKKVKQFNKKEELLFTLKQKKTNELAGLVYLKNFDWTVMQGEFAYCIGYQFEGKGLVSNAVIKLSAYAFEELKLKTLQIIVHRTNLGSVKVAKNCGFIWQKTLANEHTPPNETPLDMELYELKAN